MLFKDYILEGFCTAELDTEIKYILASAKYDSLELLRLRVRKTEDERDNSRLCTCLTKILRQTKRAGMLQLFVMPEGFVKGSTESVYLINKYGEDSFVPDVGFIDVYVKL